MLAVLNRIQTHQTFKRTLFIGTNVLLKTFIRKRRRKDLSQEVEIFSNFYVFGSDILYN